MERARLMQAGQGEEPHLRTEENKKILTTCRGGPGEEKRNHLGEKNKSFDTIHLIINNGCEKARTPPISAELRGAEVVYIAGIAV